MKSPELSLRELSLGSSDSESSTLSLLPVKRIEKSALRLNGDAILYWESIVQNPMESGVWKHITHVVLEDIWVNPKNEVVFSIDGKERELTKITNYLPWLNQLKEKYSWLKFVWSFQQSPGQIFCTIDFYTNFLNAIHTVVGCIDFIDISGFV